MFISSENYLEQLTKVIKESNDLSLAVAFWGEGADEKLQLDNSKSYRIICNLTSGGTNPNVIEKLRRHFGKTQEEHVRQLNNLHAKVVIGSKSAIVGSANFSTNGLNHENEEARGWEEAGLLCTDKERIAEIQSWFERLWTISVQITDKDIKDAHEAWDSRRHNRVINRQINSVLDLRPDELKGRQIYIIFWSEKASEEAADAFDEEKEKGSIWGSGSF